MSRQSRRFGRELLVALVTGIVAGGIFTGLFLLICGLRDVEPTAVQLTGVSWVSSMAAMGFQAYRFNRKWQKVLESYSMPSYGEADGEEYPR